MLLDAIVGLMSCTESALDMVQVKLEPMQGRQGMHLWNFLIAFLTNFRSGVLRKQTKPALDHPSTTVDLICTRLNQQVKAISIICGVVYNNDDRICC